MTTINNATAISTQMPTVTMTTLAECIREMFALNMACFIHGAPGVGKSALFDQCAKADGVGYRVDSFAALQEVDANGVPVPDLQTMSTKWMKPDFIPNVERDGPRGYWFIDEANALGPSMEPVLFRLAQERMVGTHKIPDGWVPMFAGNRIKDRASAKRMATPLRNKLAHFNVEADLESWLRWAIVNNIDPRLCAFLRHRPHLLHIMPASDDVFCFPTPRAWEKVSKLINKPKSVRHFLIESVVGDSPAAELEGFLRIAADWSSPDEAIKNPTTAKLAPEDNPAACYGMAMALSRAATRQNFDNIMTYVERWQTREFGVATIVDAVRRDPSLTQTAAFGTWAVANQDIAL